MTQKCYFRNAHSLGSEQASQSILNPSHALLVKTNAITHYHAPVYTLLSSYTTKNTEISLLLLTN